MPPKKGETPHQKVARLQKKAHELQTKALYNKVVATLKQRPDLLPAVERTLLSLGASFDSSDGGSAVELPLKRKATELPLAEMKAIEDKDCLEGDTQDPEPADEEETDGKFLPRNATSFPNMPHKHLKAILLAIEPVTFSAANMKSLVNRGAREVGRAELLKLLEFCTNVAPGSTVASEHREVVALHAHMQMLNKDVGRRARDLTFTVNWETQGIYRVTMVDDKAACVVTRSDTNEFVQVAIPTDVKSLFIDCNWSEVRASVRQQDGYWQQGCALLFSGGFATPRKKGRMLAETPLTSQPAKDASIVTGSPLAAEAVVPQSPVNAQLEFKPVMPEGEAD